MILCFIVLSSFCILLYTCANVVCIKFLLTYLLNLNPLCGWLGCEWLWWHACRVCWLYCELWCCCSPADLVHVPVYQQKTADWRQLLVHLCRSSSRRYWLLLETHEQVHAQVCWSPGLDSSVVIVIRLLQQTDCLFNYTTSAAVHKTRVRFPAAAASTGIGDHFHAGKPPQYLTKPPRPTQPAGNECQPKHGDTLWLEN